MPTRKIPLTELVALFRQMHHREWRGGRLCGEITVPDQQTADLLHDLLDEANADDYPCTIEQGDPDQVRVGDALRLHFGAVRTAIGLVVPDVAALLNYSQVAAGIAEQAWYVNSIDAASWEPDKEFHRRLTLVGRLVKALEGSASIFDPRKATLVFLRTSGRFDIPVRYAESDLMQLDESATERLIADLELKDGHSAQRHEIGATAVSEMMAGVPLERRFAEMLRRMGELHQRFVDGYRLFASSFSYEKLRDQAEALRIEYSGKIHKTISDIQGQLLGIPISTIVVATQFKPTAGAPGQIWINLAVIVGAVIFFGLLLLSVWNQSQTLSVIEAEIDRHENALRKDNADIADRLDDVFPRLRKRALVHHIALWGAVGLCLLGLLIGFAVFWVFHVTSL